MFVEDQHLRVKAFQALQNVPDSQLKREFAVENEIKADRLFLKFNVENEVYLQAVKRYKLPKEAEAKSVVKEMDEKIP